MVVQVKFAFLLKNKHSRAKVLNGSADMGKKSTRPTPDKGNFLDLLRNSEARL